MIPVRLRNTRVSLTVARPTPPKRSQVAAKAAVRTNLLEGTPIPALPDPLPVVLRMPRGRSCNTTRPVDFMHCPQIIVDSFFALFYHSIHLPSFDKGWARREDFTARGNKAGTFSRVSARPTRGLGKAVRLGSPSGARARDVRRQKLRPESHSQIFSNSSWRRVFLRSG